MTKFVETIFNQNLAEINQTLDVRFAWAVPKSRGVVTNSIPFVKCRDFLGDCLYATEKDKKQSIYGFSFDPKKQTYCKSSTKLLLQFPNVESFQNFNNNLQHLHNIEENFKYKKTVVKQVAENTLLVIGSSQWIRNIVSVSFYTFILKCISYKLTNQIPFWDAVKVTEVTITGWDGSKVTRTTLEASYLKDMDKFQYFLRTYKKFMRVVKTATSPEYDTINYVHNRSGFYSIINGRGTYGQMFLKDYNNGKK